MLCGSIHETMQKEELNIIKNKYLLDYLRYGIEKDYLNHLNRIIIPKNKFININTIDNIYEIKNLNNLNFDEE